MNALNFARCLLPVSCLLFTGCFERGGAKAHRDAGAPVATIDAAPAVRAEPAGPADPAASIAIALEAEPATLDPVAGADQVTQRIVMGDVYEALLAPGPTLADPPVAGLADEWTVSSDGRTWRFHLRAAKFHDGHALGTEDVIATFEGVATGQSWLAGDLADLEIARTVEPGVVELVFGAARIERAIAFARTPVLRDGHADARLPVGTGPLQLVEWRTGEAIELARFDDYWGAPAGAAHVTYRIAADRAQALRMLEAGDVDLAVQVPVDEATRFAAAHRGIGRFGYRLPAYITAILNARRIPDVNVRRALAALLDREGVARLLGSQTIAGPFPCAVPCTAYPDGTPRFDRAAAEQLLGSARPALEVLVPQGSTTMARVADIWASDARGLVTLTVTQVPYADLLTRLSRGEVDIALTSMSTSADLDLTSRLSSKAPAEDAWSGIHDAELDRLLDAVATERDAAKRGELRRALHGRILELAPMIFIAADVRQGLARADIGGIAGAREGGPPRAAGLWRSR